MPDPVNHPEHYALDRRFEVIDVIEDSVQFAPDPVLGGLQWQILKYVHRCWGKDNSVQDLKKARWYLDRLIVHLEAFYGKV
ncbi:MAG: DUF3310 domain-containing protein [Aquiluna sp.]